MPPLLKECMPSSLVRPPLKEGRELKLGDEKDRLPLDGLLEVEGGRNPGSCDD
jgi:hypothetical protein